MRTFPTGATRDSDDGKLDYEGFLSPLVLERYAEYMHAHRVQADGTLRDSDNWQKGIPKDAYMKSLWRHFMDVWKMHRGVGDPAHLQDALCAVLFNAMGYLHEELRHGACGHERVRVEADDTGAPTASDLCARCGATRREDDDR